MSLPSLLGERARRWPSAAAYRRADGAAAKRAAAAAAAPRRRRGAPSALSIPLLLLFLLSYYPLNVSMQLYALAGFGDVIASYRQGQSAKRARGHRSAICSHSRQMARNSFHNIRFVLLLVIPSNPFLDNVDNIQSLSGDSFLQEIDELRPCCFFCTGHPGQHNSALQHLEIAFKDVVMAGRHVKTITVSELERIRCEVCAGRRRWPARRSTEAAVCCFRLPSPLPKNTTREKPYIQSKSIHLGAGRQPCARQVGASQRHQQQQQQQHCGGDSSSGGGRGPAAAQGAERGARRQVAQHAAGEAYLRGWV